MTSPLLITNARIWTSRSTPEANAVLIEGGRFSFVGDKTPINPPAGATRLDLGGRRMIPGITDAHAHLLATGFAMTSVDLKGVPSVEEAALRVAERAQRAPAGSWITGAGWDQHEWPNQRFPSRADLDAAAPDHPVFLTHTSGHCTWVNTTALRAAGITAAASSPPGGAIDIDDHGEPTGILRDNASRLVSDAMPPPSQSDRIAAMKAAIGHAHSLGITGAHAMNVGRGEFQALHALNDSRELTLRTRMFLAHEKLDEWIERNLATGDGDDILRVGGVKYFSDGALGSLTAWMDEPYAASGGTGFPLQSIEDLERDVRRAFKQGLAPAIHAIGDRANSEVLDLLERCAALSPTLPRRIEHAQLLRAADISRFAANDITVSAQPIHATQDWRKVDREWGERGAFAYAFASLERTGANLAFGSDTPVETMDPLAGVHAAVTRQTAAGEPDGGWYPTECLVIEDALHHYTAGPAIATRESTTYGAIAPGLAADFVVLSHDILDPSAESSILHARVVATYVNGAPVFQA